MGTGVHKQKIYIALGIFVLILFFLLIGAREYLHWAEVQYFGEIAAFEGGGFFMRAGNAELWDLRATRFGRLSFLWGLATLCLIFRWRILRHTLTSS